MAINYPNGTDTFSEPTLPEYTSLSAGGADGRGHVDHHRDLGDAVEMLQTYAAKRGHDHSGDASDTAKGARLSWKNAHEASPPVTTLAAAQAYADTDLSALSVHHTLATNLPTSGTAGQYQAAPGHHTHAYSTITGITWLTGLTAARPSTAADGTVYYATDTNRVWAYGTFGGTKRWALLPVGSRPVCRLRQTTPQTINKTSGSVITWGDPPLEDTFNYFAPGAPSAITVSEPGLYHVEAAMQWDESFVPDVAYASVTLNGDETGIREQRWVRGNGILPGFSQSVSVSGHVRVTTAGQVIALKVKSGGATIVEKLLSYIDPSSKVQSRIDVIYISP